MSALENIQIEKNIPVPAKKRLKRKFTWVSLAEKMKVGDSVVVNEQGSRNLYVALRTINHKAITRSVGGNEFRVWKGKKIAK